MKLFQTIYTILTGTLLILLLTNRAYSNDKILTCFVCDTPFSVYGNKVEEVLISLNDITNYINDGYRLNYFKIDNKEYCGLYKVER